MCYSTVCGNKLRIGTKKIGAVRDVERLYGSNLQVTTCNTPGFNGFNLKRGVVSFMPSLLQFNGGIRKRHLDDKAKLNTDVGA